MILQKQQGISTNQLGKGTKGLEKVIESIMQIFYDFGNNYGCVVNLFFLTSNYRI